MKVEKLTAAHVRALKIQRAQGVDVAGILTDQAIEDMVNQEAWALLDGDEVLACGGYHLLWPGRYQIWALLGETIGPVGLLVWTRTALRFMALLGPCRIETIVRDGFEEGHRWVRLLGFKCETAEPMRRYMPDGGSAFLYSRVI